MFTFRKADYKTKMILCYLIPIALLLLVVSVPLYYSVVKPVKDNSFETMVNSVSQEVSSVRSELEKIKNISYTISTNTVINNFFMPNYYSDLDIVTIMNQDIIPLLSWLSASNPYIEDYNFFTNNTYIPETNFLHQYEKFQKENWLLDMEEKIFEEGYYLEPLHEKRSYETFSSDSTQKVYSLFYPLLYSENYLEVEITPSVFFSSFSDTQVLSSGFLVAADQNAQIISGNVSESLKTDLEKLLKEQYKTSKYPDSPYQIRTDSTSYYVYSSSIEELDTRIFCMVPSSDIDTTLNRTIQYFFIILVILALVVILLSYFLSTLLVKRINTIISSIHKIQNENFDIHIPINGNDEIDQLASAINFMAAKINSLINQVYKTELLQKETELSALQAQINPHFLFNILDTFKMIAVIHDLDDFSESIASLGSFLRYNICPASNQCRLADEIKVLENYIAIQNLLLNNRITLCIDIPDDLLDIQIPNFILQPLVENSFSHGFKDKLGALFIKLTVFLEHTELHICIEDNGAGISPERKQELDASLEQVKVSQKCTASKHGIGLSNVYLRLLLQYQGQVSLTLGQSDLGGVCILLQFPAVIKKEVSHEPVNL